MQEGAIVLLSGGLDSATALGWARTKWTKLVPIQFYYGQRHRQELYNAERLCDHYSLAMPIYFDLSQPFAMIGGSSLTSGRLDTNPSEEPVERTPSDLPPTFVPGRNLVMLSIASALAYVQQVNHVVGGWNAVDYSGYPDCRPEFFDAAETAIYEALGLRGTGTYIKIDAPLVDMTKVQIIQLGMKLLVPYGLTWSCYSGGDAPCGTCDSCKIRAAGFAEAGLTDPALHGVL